MQPADAASSLVDCAEPPPDEVVECLPEILMTEAARDVNECAGRSHRRDAGSYRQVGIEQLA